jgi:hypothetical protein
MADKSFIGKGKIYIGPYDNSGPKRLIGNCSKLELAIAQEEKSLIDFTNAGGGKANSLKRITGVTANMTLHDLDGPNLAMATYGSSTAVTTVTAIVDESHASVKKGTTGGFVATDRLINTAVAPVVKVAAATKTLGTDYTVGSTGIFIPAGSSILDNDTVLISYTPVAEDQVEALVNTGTEFKLHFDGLNEAQSGKPAAVILHRIKFTPASGLGLISDDFAGLELSAEVLSDTAQSVGSKYFDIRIAQ